MKLSLEKIPGQRQRRTERCDVTLTESQNENEVEENPNVGQYSKSINFYLI